MTINHDPDERIAELLTAALPDPHYFDVAAIQAAGARRRRARSATRLVVGAAAGLVLVGGVAASTSWLPVDEAALEWATGGGEAVLAIDTGTESPVTSYAITGKSLGDGVTEVTVRDPGSSEVVASFTASRADALSGIEPRPSHAKDGMWLAVVPNGVAPVSVTSGPGQRVGQVDVPGSDLQVVAINGNEDKGGGQRPTLYWSGPQAGSTQPGAILEHAAFAEGRFAGYSLTWSPDLKILDLEAPDGTSGGGYDNSSPQEPIVVMESTSRPGAPNKLLAAVIPGDAKQIRVIDDSRTAPTWTVPMGKSHIAVIADVTSYDSEVQWTSNGQRQTMANTPTP